MKKTSLVTGGAGFLGSHLCTSLLDSGHKVIALDNLSTGKYSNISNLLKNADFSFIDHDIRDVLSGFGQIDEIWNLACPASPPAYQEDPVGTLKTNFIGALRLLDLAALKRSKVFQASTSEIYGDPLVHPQPESYLGNTNTVGPRSCYDEGKRVVESLMTDYSKQYRVPVKIARIFNTYGPNLFESDGRVVSNFINQSLSGKDITVYGSGLQTRSFCYVSDLISGFRLLMNTQDDFIRPVNLGNPIEFTMLELAKLIIDKTESTSKIVFSDLPVDDPKQRKPDISLAKEFLNWYPVVDINTGITKTIDYFKRGVALNGY